MSAKIRLFCNQSLRDSVSVFFNEMQLHYLVNVMRAKPKQHIMIFNNQDGEWLAEITEASKKNCSAIAIQKLRDPEELRNLHLYFAPIKNPTASFIVQKATELGATHITPVKCMRSVVDKVNPEKLYMAAIEATEQCGRVSTPEIHDLQPLKKIIETKEYKGPLLFFYEEEKNLFLNKGNYNPSWKNMECGILIGPEGGFDKEEYELLTSKDWVIPISLGKRILKAETATIAALSTFQALYGD